MTAAGGPAGPAGPAGPPGRRGTDEADGPDGPDGTATSGRRYGGLGAPERALRRRESLLAAGLESFGTAGYRASTVRGICRLAGLTDRYFYESFPNMEDLLVAVYEREVGRLRDAVVDEIARTPGRSLDDLVHDVLDAYFRRTEDPRAARVLWVEVLGVSARVDEAWSRALRDFADLLLGVGVSHTATAGMLGSLDPAERRVLLHALVGAVDRATVAWAHGGYAVPRATVVRGVARVLLGALRA